MMKKNKFLLVLSLALFGLLLPTNLGAQSGIPSTMKKLFTINTTTTDGELEIIKSKIKEGYEVDMIYSLQRNTEKQITSLLLNLKGEKTNNNISLSGDQPIEELHIIIKPNKQLGIWSKRSERNKAVRESRLKKNDSLRATRLSDMKIRQEKIRERMKNRFEGGPKRGRIQLESESGKVSVQLLPKNLGAEPLYILEGKEVTKDVIIGLLPDDIESVNISKGETASLTYGEKGSNGVVVVILKN